MPWDTVLNQDVHVSFDCHVVLTKDADEKDETKFSGSTPARMAHAHERPLDLDRNIHDVRQVFKSSITVCQAEGVVVEDFKKFQKGNMHHEVEVTKWGGARKRKHAGDDCRLTVVHPDAEEALKERIDESKNKLTEVCSDGFVERRANVKGRCQSRVI